MAILASCSENQTSLNLPQKGGLFTWNLIATFEENEEKYLIDEYEKENR
jgi:hypothetical protein